MKPIFKLIIAAILVLVILSLWSSIHFGLWKMSQDKAAILEEQRIDQEAKELCPHWQDYDLNTTGYIGIKSDEIKAIKLYSLVYDYTTRKFLPENYIICCGVVGLNCTGDYENRTESVFVQFGKYHRELNFNLTSSEAQALFWRDRWEINST